MRHRIDSGRTTNKIAFRKVFPFCKRAIRSSISYLVPYPKNAETFWKFVKLGSELRQIHLLESPVVNKFITTYPVNGSNEVTKLKYEGGKVWINIDQYFDHVPQVAWEFYIGGYQPAQK